MRGAYVCDCSHRRGDHYNTKQNPNGPCQLCGCSNFTPEPVCRCGHGNKAHRKGYCHEGDCKQFRPVN